MKDPLDELEEFSSKGKLLVIESDVNKFQHAANKKTLRGSIKYTEREN